MLLPDLPLFLGDTQYSQFTHVPFASFIFLAGKHLLNSDLWVFCFVLRGIFYSC